MKKYILPLILILLLTFTLVGNCADLYGTYDQRIKLTIDNTKIDSDLTWFPVLIKLTNAQMEEVFAEFDSDDDFDRCAITLADESTQIYGDCERFDDSGEVAEYHVAKTGVVTDADAAGYLYFYYDKDAAHNTTYISKSGDTAAQSVYDANFIAVYHMHDFNNWDTQYEATVEPDDDGWTLGGTDYSSVAGGILTIDTSADDGYTCYYYKTPDVDFDAGFYLKTSVKASTDMDDVSDALIIQIQDGTQNQQFWMKIRDGEVSYFREPNTTVDIAMDTTTAYVTYEIYIKASTFWIYADGVQKASQTLDAATVSDLVQFGDISVDAGQMCKAEIDYVYYSLGVTDNPLLTIFDSTSNNNDGTKKGIGEPIEATGKVGQAQDFDGADDYVSAGTLTLGSNFTFSCIIKPGLIDLLQQFIGYRTDVGNFDWRFIRQTADETIVFYLRTSEDISNAITSSTTVEVGTSYYISGTYDGTTAKLLVNGVSEDSDTLTLTNYANTEQKIGTHAGDATTEYDGIIDEARFSDSGRADAWEKATYESLWDSLLTYGSEETSGVVTTNILFTFTNF